MNGETGLSTFSIYLKVEMVEGEVSSLKIMGHLILFKSPCESHFN